MAATTEGEAAQRRPAACRHLPWAAALLVAVAAASAQDRSAQQEAIEKCRRAPSDAARITCLEAALAAAARDAEATPEDAPASPAAARGDPQEPGPEAPGADRAAPPAAGIGAEQLERPRSGAPASVKDLAVRRYTRVPYRRLQVHLENGQVWRQIEGDTQEIRASLRKNRTVDIEESVLGGYKLRLNEMRRTIRVRRVR